ncbi:MAG: glycine-rich domain-containing protein [Verrucomicrobiota bacterium]
MPFSRVLKLLTGFNVLAALLLAPPANVFAADSIWTNTTAGGNFGDTTAIWSNGVPGVNDNAIFTNNFAYSVTNVAGASFLNANASFNGTSGIVTGKFGTGTWTLTNSFIVGQNAGNTATVVWVNGTLAVTNGGTAQLIVGGIGSTGSSFNLYGGTAIVNKVTINSGATLNFNGGTLGVGAGGTTVSGTGAVRIAASQTAFVDTMGNNATINSVIQGSNGGLTKSGTGMLVLGTNNTFTGNLTVNAGTVMVMATNTPLANQTVNLTGGSKFTFGQVTTNFTTSFTSSTTWVDPAGVSSANLLVVGGGGGGGGNRGGGGGGGGVTNLTVSLTPGNTYTITVGTGGGGGSANVAGTKGGNSAFSNAVLTALGGGGGGSFGAAATSGGSGGGGDNNSAHFAGGTGTPGQGNAGGTGVANDSAGGGGAGGVGSNGQTGVKGGNGGIGLYFAAFSSYGASGYFGGGGGGGSGSSGNGGGGVAGTGGLGGGANGTTGDNNAAPTAAQANTGGGGGGETGGGSGTGSAGGSGIVLVQWVGQTTANYLLTNVNFSLLTGAILDFSGNNVSIASLAGGDASGIVTNSSSTLASIFTITNATGSATYDGQITGGGAISLVKAGGGTEILTGSNTFSGTVTVNGGTLMLGSLYSLGVSNSVTVSTGGSIVATNAGTSYIVGNGGSNVTVLISGSGSLWTNAGAFVIGSGAATGNVVTVNAGTLAAGALMIGTNGAMRNSLLITNGGQVVGTVASTLGFTANSNTITVAGNGALWNSSAAGITVGTGGSTGNVLNVNSGGSVIANGLTINAGATDWSNFVNVAAGSLFVTNAAGSASLIVGGNGLVLANNGLVVVSSNLVIGATGLGTFTTSGGSIAGVAGQNLSVILGQTTTGTGVFTVASGSTYITNGGNAKLIIGQSGRGTLTLNGGNLIVDQLFMTNNTATTTNSFLTSTSSANVTIQNGSRFNVNLAQLAINGTWLMAGGQNTVSNMVAGAQNQGTAFYIGVGGTLAVTGANTVLSYIGLLDNQPYPGAGVAGLLVVSNQARAFFTGGGGANAVFAIGPNATVTVNNASMTFSNEIVGVGHVANSSGSTPDSRGTLIVTNQGYLTAVSGIDLGGNSGGTIISNLLLIAGGGVVSNYGALRVAGQNANLEGLNYGNHVDITSGGQMINTNTGNNIGFASFSAATIRSNNYLWVSGQTSTGTFYRDLTVGFGNGSQGTSVNNYVQLDTGGTLLASNLTVSSGAGASNNYILVNGGNLYVTNAAADGGVLVVGQSGQASLTITNGGMVKVGSLIVTNYGTYVNTVAFNGGTLSAKNITNNNGSAFKIGNGISAATLSELGGQSYFANGISVANNGTITGGGTNWLGSTLQNSGYIIASSPTAELAFTNTVAGMAFGNGGTLIAQAGATLSFLGSPGSSALTNYGTINLLGGTVRGTTITNLASSGWITGYGTINNSTVYNQGTILFNSTTPLVFGGGQLVNAPGGVVTANVGRISVSGIFTNAGKFVALNSVGTFNSTVVNSGTWITDPTTLVFNGTFSNGPNALIQMALGDVYIFKSNFLNQSVSSLNSTTYVGRFVFAGDSNVVGKQTMQVAGLALGGYGSTLNVVTQNEFFTHTDLSTTQTGNFSTNRFDYVPTDSITGFTNNWALSGLEVGSLSITSELWLADSFASGTHTAGLYVSELTINPGSRLVISNNVHLYFGRTNSVYGLAFGSWGDNPTANILLLNGAGYHLLVIPEPGVVMLWLAGAATLWSARRRRSKIS